VARAQVVALRAAVERNAELGCAVWRQHSQTQLERVAGAQRYSGLG
jgi:hypothetical protein